MSIQPPSINNIKVGYISQTEGYIQGLTISQANTHENLNPGTVYIFVDGDGKECRLKGSLRPELY